ncbi:LRR domain containing protein [Trema orientale]|uniref:LRR domain containing protein n=1 Tax=Trema orientale TaxID=63057 RepID=A0A2P5A6G0_TREOI|nr:LRR domain containing protein [Trema orientale]
MAIREGYYQDSVTVMNKGLEMVFVKILTIFTSIDLSHNNFHGEIPTTIGDLPSLIVLNLSSNHFEGLILSSLGNLKQLESLDLSNNKLVGRIPQQLASLTFLAYLNLSMNQLTGPIPQGGQFSTFPISSFVGNVELCGFPLSKKCGIPDEQPTPDEEPESEKGFSWKAVLVGYGCSFVIGAIGGNIVISKKPNWLVRIYGRRL